MFSWFWRKSLRLEHLYFVLQAETDGLDVAMGHRSLIEADLPAGRMIIPFENRTRRQENYSIILCQDRQHDPVVKTFCDWLEEGTQFDNTIVPVLKKSMFSASEL
ncbi:DNA-binding transcriptional LysR family regulator [Caballeronia udeis]|uniref:DNA-binding transcriptional LysR family regulator n=1 Tax=Caballeronia udeis TaxID=1232866 RepID=A0ABW8MWJ2_9BURK